MTGVKPSITANSKLIIGTVRISRESPCGEVLALVRFGGEMYWWVDYRAAIGGTQYDAPGSYTTTQTENIKQLRVACSECTCTVSCG
jgi:hypothetical protein